MNLAELNAKIEALPLNERVEARYMRDERLGILWAEKEPDEDMVRIVHEQLFPGEMTL